MKIKYKNISFALVLIFLAVMASLFGRHLFGEKRYINTEYGFEFGYPRDYALMISNKKNIPSNHDMSIVLTKQNTHESLIITVQRLNQPHAIINEGGWVRGGFPVQKDVIIGGEKGRYIEYCWEGCYKVFEVANEWVGFKLTKLATDENVSIDYIAESFKFLEK